MTREQPRPAPRFTARHVAMVAGILIVASLPFLVLGANPASRAAGTATPPPRGTDTGDVELVELLEFECLPVAKDETVGEEQYAVPLPPFSKDVFPCTRCHDKPDDFNPTPRNLTLDHLGIKLVHGPREQWCYGCHNPTDRDTLRLAGGRTVSFTKSYELCGQCHGPKLRDWRLGIHGRRTGCWNGKHEYLLCVHCHDPHAPEFPAVAPMPRPKTPAEIRLDHNAENEQ